jgi:hypothetical protein
LFFKRYSGHVADSAELRRILALPRRIQPPRGTEKLSDALRRPGGEQTLRPVQAQALAELHLVGGLLGLIRVGGGKTLISFLAPHVLPVERPLLLVPAKLRDKTRAEFHVLMDHWHTPACGIHVESYEKLGRTQWADFFERYEPDMLICDEVHRLKNVRAAITRRVGRYLDRKPETHFVGLSGTVAQRSLMDYVHIADWALGSGSPVPRTFEDIQQWCCALDEDSLVGDNRFGPGALEILLDGGGYQKSVFGGYHLDDVRHVVHRRLIETPGVVATTESPIDASLIIDEWLRGYQHAPVVREAFEKLYMDWEDPDGTEFFSAVDVWRCARTLALGFYYRWEPRPPAWWLEPRRKWSATVRQILLRSRSLDSPKQVEEKFRNTKVFRDWAAVRRRYTPSVVPVWLDDDVVQKSCEWGRKEGIVWVEHQAVASAIEKLGMPFYGQLGRDKAGVPIEEAPKGVGIAASIEANKEGRNLQRYCRNLVLTPPTTGQVWEQLIGRTHRDGQLADEVSVDVFFGCKENTRAFIQAKNDAKYQKSITGSPQKLLEATIIFEAFDSRKKKG